jgi:predicted nucleic acid-binding protein
MLDYENDANPYDEKHDSIAPWAELAVEYCSSSTDILSMGIDIMKHGIQNKDALHIACAIHSGCEYFITTDKKLLNKDIPNIRIISPINFVTETEDLQ